MTPEHLMTRPATLLRHGPATPDQFGQANSGAGALPVRCYARQLSTGDDTIAETETWLVLLPVGTPVTSGDRIDLDAATILTVSGVPTTVVNPRTRRPSHMRLTAGRAR